MGRGRFLLALVVAAMLVAVIGPALAAPSSPSPPSAPSPPTPPGPGVAPSPTPGTPKSPAPSRARESAEAVFLGIQASKESSPHVDPALQSLADLLPMSKYNSFRVVVSETQSVLAGGETGIALVEGYGLALRIEKMTADSAQIVLSWTRVEKDAKGKAQARPPQRVQMTLRRGKYFLTGGWQLQNGALFALVAVK
jgi:hypothetical protein